MDGAGTIAIVDLAKTTATSVTLPNPPVANAAGRTNPRTQTIMDMALVNGRLVVAGLSNEEFASKLWSVPYPFATTDRGTSIEIFHGNHGRLETNSPIFSFVPYNVAGQPNVIAGYLCTPLVKIPMSALKPGEKVLGTTIAELGSGNRPIDMIVYTKGGQEYLLMSNTNRGVMKIPTSQFAHGRRRSTRAWAARKAPSRRLRRCRALNSSTCSTTADDPDRPRRGWRTQPDVGRSAIDAGI